MAGTVNNPQDTHQIYDNDEELSFTYYANQYRIEEAALHKTESEPAQFIYSVFDTRLQTDEPVIKFAVSPEQMKARCDHLTSVLLKYCK